MRLVIFEGTKEEFEAVKPLTRSEEDGDLTVSHEPDQENGQDNFQEVSDSTPTYDEAVKILRFHGGPSENQKKILRVLFDSDGPVASSAIREAYGWSNAEFRGIRANFSRRANGALDRDGVEWVKRNWLSEEGENQYSLPSAVRQALTDELGW